ncbi:type IV pilus biogenesis/stability protein PilW [Sansalvadorimonas verongulae]|uniref:type IV pilus biogenesis/stability protein PilW n=1 Tax=Sansalvadorimonas verongulae TaxID=2172824 RepID=UPI0012BD6E69|nr:type IV pilus biogenesis/stability protein PilW [Sansalvadorimonas verongulae]MTI12979.1 type IV pilus biogenesis/stability protein PilW [Sansalvadorimonas verongulae]
MDRPVRSSLKTLALVASLALSGCVSTLPPERPARDPATFEQKNLDIAFGFLQEGYPGRAIGRLNEILKVNRRSARAYGMLGVVYQSQGEYDLAEDNFARSLSIDSSASDVRNNYGVLLYEQGKYTKAREQFLRVTEDVYYQQRSRAFENLGFVALQMNDLAQARQQFERALRLDRNLLRASLEMAELLYNDGNYVESERFYNNYLRLSTGRPGARSLWLGIKLARVFKDKDRLDEYVDQLTRYYPGSQEYRNYQASLRNG